MGLYLSPNGGHNSVGMGTCDGWGACGEVQFSSDIGLILNMLGCNFRSGSLTTTGVWKTGILVQHKIYTNIFICYFNDIVMDNL